MGPVQREYSSGVVSRRVRWELLVFFAVGCGFSKTASGVVDGPPIDMPEEAVQVPRVGGAKALWRFNEGAGSSVLDQIPPPSMASPLHFTINPVSAVAWVPGGLRLTNRVTIETVANPHIGAEIVASKEFTIEVWVATSDVSQGTDAPDPPSAPDHATVVNVSASIISFNALIGQVGSTWIGRARTTVTGADARPEIASSAGIVQVNKISHLVLVANTTERLLYVDGIPLMSSPVGAGMLNWDPSYAIRIGDAINYERQWLGTIYFMAIYDRALTAAEVMQNRSARHDCTEC